MATQNYHDFLFSSIKSQFGEDAAKASGAALCAIFSPYRDLKPDVATAARYLRASIENKTEVLHNIYLHLCERRKRVKTIPGCYETLLTQMVPRDKIGARNIVVSGVDNRVSDAARSDEGEGFADGAADGATEGEGEGDGDGAADADAEGDECEDAGAKAACIYNSGAADDDFCQGELLPVSKNEFRAATKTAAELLGLTPWGLKDFRSSLKSIPRASLRAYSQHANIASIDCYTSSRVTSLREARLSSFINAAKSGVHDAVKAVDELEKRSDVDRALVALILPAVFRTGTFVRLARLDTLALSRVLDAVAKMAARALEDDALIDALALDARVVDAISDARDGRKSKRLSPRKRKPSPKAGDESQDNPAGADV